jgi:hypothetical protein
VGTYKLSLYLENWLPVTSLLARKNSLIDIPGNSSLKALKFLQHCAAVFMKLAGFLPNSLFFPALQGISTGDQIARDCLHSQPVPSLWDMSRSQKFARHSRELSRRLRVSVRHSSQFQVTFGAFRAPVSSREF